MRLGCKSYAKLVFYDPPANRRSRKHATKAWLKLTAGPRPRLSIVSYVDYEQLSKGGVIGPYSSRRSANAARVAIEEVFALDRVGDKGISDTVSDEDYPALADLAYQALSDNATLVVDPLMQRIQALAQVQRYEDAGVITKRCKLMCAAWSGFSACVRCLPVPIWFRHDGAA